MSSRSKRTQYIALIAALVLIYILFFSTSDSTDFRATTESAIARKHSVLLGDESDEDLTAQANSKLQEILANREGALDSGEKIVLEGSRTDPKAKPYAQDIESDEIPVAGRKTMPKVTPSPYQGAYITQQKPKYPLREDEEVAYNGAKVESAADPGEERAREELQSILKRSPIIIFSKSYCPYSKRAKKLLLETYTITPAPYVVELDLMTEKVPASKKASDDDDEPIQPTLGKKVQDLLATLTGRRTVPNIMINAQSLGGSDEVTRMDGDGTLIEMIKKMGGKRIVAIEKNDDDDDDEHSKKKRYKR
jgi:glutaredoxin